jgi:hypothetical protein
LCKTEISQPAGLVWFVVRRRHASDG